MKNILLLSFVAVFFIGCVNQQKRPKDVLSDKKMAEVMWNLIKADEYISNFVMKDSSRNKKEESLKLYEQVFRILGTSGEQFQKSMAFYRQRPDLLKGVMDSLRIYESTGMTEMVTPSAIPDSVLRMMKKKPPAKN